MSSEPSLPFPAAEAEPAWKSLSPRAPLAAVVPLLGMLLRSFAGALLPVFFLREGGFSLVIWGVLLLLAALLLSAGLYEVATLRYRMVGAQLEIRSGLLTKTSRFIDAARVQNTEVLQPFVSKLLGLVELKVETASGQKAEGHLRGLTPKDAQALIDALHAARGQEAPALAPAAGGAMEGEVLAQARLADLLRYGATATGLGCWES
jgi:putative membrane protein